MPTHQNQTPSPAAANVPLHTLTLPDGRILSYATYGAASPTAPTLLYLHGFPASHAEAQPWHLPALRHGIRLLAPDRPGMGGSTFQPSRAMADWPADARALLNALAPPPARVAIVGVSAGAAYALACCCCGSDELRGRVVGVGIVAGLYPPALGLGGMLWGARALLCVAPWWTAGVRWGLEWGLGGVARGADGGALERVVAGGMAGRPPPDRAVFEGDEGGCRAAMVESVRGAFAVSAEGPAWDARLLGGEWGFGLEDVRVRGPGRRVVLWHGDADVNVSVGMAERAAALMAGVAELRVVAGEAHASLAVHKVDEVLVTLKGFLLE